MKNPVIAILVLFVMITGVCHAKVDSDDVIKHRWVVGLNLGRYYPVQNNLSSAKSTLFGGSVDYKVTEEIYAGLDVSSVGMDVSNRDIFEGGVVTGDKIRVVPLIARVRVGKHFDWADQDVFPYLMAGVGYSLNEWVVSDSSAHYGIDNEIVYKAGFGLELFWHETFTGFFEVFHQAQKPEAHYSAGALQLDSRINLSADILQVGIRMFF